MVKTLQICNMHTFKAILDSMFAQEHYANCKAEPRIRPPALWLMGNTLPPEPQLCVQPTLSTVVYNTVRQQYKFQL